MLIGICASIVCFYAIKFRIRMGWDDALDVWGCHGVGGIVGSVLTGVFAAKEIGGFSGLLEGNQDQFLANLYATGIAIAFAFVATYILLMILKTVMKITVELKEEADGLDRALHGEEAYDF